MQENSSTFSFKQNLCALALFFALLLAITQALGNTYQKATAKNKVNEWSKQRFTEFAQSPPNTIDMVFLGSSHSYCTFDPLEIDKHLGTNSYQLGMPLQHPDSSYYTLLKLLETQTPATVVLELYWDVLDADFSLKQVDSFFLVLDDPLLEKDYIKNVFPLNEKVKYAIKPIRFQQDFFAYQNSLLLDFCAKRFQLTTTKQPQPQGEEYYRSKGYIYCDYILSPEEVAKAQTAPLTNGSKWQISKVQQGYIEKIAQTCHDKGIQLVLVTAPVSPTAFKQITDYPNIHNQIATLATALDAPYLDYNMVNAQTTIFAPNQFRDLRHLNHQGVQVADAYFANWLISNGIKTPPNQ